eukprot:CAMPEP_0119547414 /NCGR_PEP_ID=MMETSP1352-20130426/1544_1 /TAXON_ID=265584 /ORGANISM="Stauroneis constricta, Strain CCMP1120" /LENGTH=529 /DNA_ID=CAMNT_0007592337 /DNA_START=360 /DNA_END=1948 /DNA_ORIENTATION=-
MMNTNEATGNYERYDSEITTSNDDERNNNVDPNYFLRNNRNRHDDDNNNNNNNDNNGDSSVRSTASHEKDEPLIPASLVAFLMGGLLYFVLAIWDLASPLDDDEADVAAAVFSAAADGMDADFDRLRHLIDDDGVGGETVLGGSDSMLPPISRWDWYDILSVVAPLMYVINFVVDIYDMEMNPNGAAHTPYPTGHQMIIPIGLFGIASFTDVLGAVVYLVYYPDDVDVDADHASASADGGDASSIHLQHASGNTVTFTEVMTYLAEYEVLPTLAVHFYLIQAIVALWAAANEDGYSNYWYGSVAAEDGHGVEEGRMEVLEPLATTAQPQMSTLGYANGPAICATTAHRPHPHPHSATAELNTPDVLPSDNAGHRQGALYRVGDALFLIGCVIDVVISYLDEDGMEVSHQRMMQVWALISATLWFADAIIYIVAGIADRWGGCQHDDDDNDGGVGGNDYGGDGHGTGEVDDTGDATTTRMRENHGGQPQSDSATSAAAAAVAAAQLYHDRDHYRDQRMRQQPSERLSRPA